MMMMTIMGLDDDDYDDHDCKKTKRRRRRRKRRRRRRRLILKVKLNVFLLIFSLGKVYTPSSELFPVTTQ